MISQQKSIERAQKKNWNSPDIKVFRVEKNHHGNDTFQ